MFVGTKEGGMEWKGEERRGVHGDDLDNIDPFIDDLEDIDLLIE